MLSSSVIFVYSLRRWCVIIIFVIVYYYLYRAICQQSFIVFVIFIHDSVSPSSTAHRESTMTDGQCRKPKKDPEGEVPAFVRHIQNSNRIKLSCTGIMHHDNRYKHTNISPSRAEMRCSSTDGVVAVSELCQSRPKFLWPSEWRIPVLRWFICKAKMSFSVRPAFTFNLNQIIVGSIKFGKYDGIHACLTAATSTDKVILLCIVCLFWKM